MLKWRLLPWQTALFITLLGLLVPVGYFVQGHRALSAEVRVVTQIRAEAISAHIGRSPEMWRFEVHRLQELLTRNPKERANEYTSVLDSNGQVVAEAGSKVASPWLVHRLPLFDAGVDIGQLQVRHSLHPLLLQALALGAACLALFGALGLRLAQLQVRSREFEAAMMAEQEQARVTLNSIGDAVITTDAHLHVVFLNPVAERLTQWPLEEALGRPLNEVCKLLDETTMQPMDTMVRRAVNDGRFCEFSGQHVALVRRDGSAMAIEDSAAAMKDAQGVVIGGVMVFRDVTGTRRMAQRIAWAATHDALTGLVNRREFETRLDAALESVRMENTAHVMCYLDLDQFKLVNDTCGHAAGDLLLKQVSDTLLSQLRSHDTLARLGGDEFGLLLRDCSLEDAEHRAADLLAAVRTVRFHWEGQSFTCGASLGLVEVNASTQSRADLFAAADSACYTAKEQGRDRACAYRSSDAELAQRRHDLHWAARLTKALEEERLVLYFQPYLPLGTCQGGGVHIEILLRLRDEDGTLVAPAAFLPAAERYNLMPAIDRWVIEQVFSRYQDLAAQMGAPLVAAINLSGTTLNSEDILTFIQVQAQLHPIPPGGVCFEITESAAIHNMHKAKQFMHDVKALGFSFALDDFGIGTSSLAYLKTLPVDYLKIDGSFVRNLVNDPIDRAMTETINRVGHIMGLKTVGEYAESQAVIDELRRLGVDYAQGYGVQRPTPLPPLRSAVANSRHAALSVA